MTKEERNWALAGLLIGAIPLLIMLMRKWPGIGDAIRYVENGNFFAPPPAIGVPTLVGGDIVFDFPIFGGDPFSGTPVAGSAGGCGCQPYTCPAKAVEFVTLPPLITSIATNIVPPYQSPTLAKTCAWNAPGYLSANPDVAAAWGTAGELKFRKKRKYGNTLNDWARFHWNEWGIAEGRSYDC